MNPAQRILLALVAIALLFMGVAAWWFEWGAQGYLAAVLLSLAVVPGAVVAFELRDEGWRGLPADASLMFVALVGLAVAALRSGP